MIDITKLTWADIGWGVIYIETGEQGYITSFNKKFIFVAFGKRTMGRGEAVYPDGIKWMTEAKGD
jgi:hypothetical protein